MQSNLPPGCSDSDIPGNTPMDLTVDKAISNKECVACLWQDVNEDDETPCCDGCENKCDFTELDSDDIAERIRAEADAREDGHSDE